MTTTRDTYTDLSIKALMNVKLALEDAGYQVDVLPKGWETANNVYCSLQVKERGQHVGCTSVASVKCACRCA
jgi:hypothetical protein